MESNFENSVCFQNTFTYVTFFGNVYEFGHLLGQLE